jgi:hypothetical protein
MTKTSIAPHLPPTDDLRKRLDDEVGGLSITLKNRGLDWLFYDLDGKTIVAHYFPAQGLLNIHANGSARPTFQATGTEPDHIPPLLKQHLRDYDDGDGEGPPSTDRVPIRSDLSDRQRDLLFRLVVAMAGNHAHAKTAPSVLVKRARDIVIEATNIKLQDEEDPNE